MGKKTYFGYLIGAFESKNQYKKGVLTGSSESIVSGIMSGFFSSLSFPSTSLLPLLLSLGPGDPSLDPFSEFPSFRRRWQARRALEHGIRRANTTAKTAIIQAKARPIVKETAGERRKAVCGFSVKYRANFSSVTTPEIKISVKNIIVKIILTALRC